MIKGILLSVVLAPPIVAAIIVIVQVHHIFMLCHPLFWTTMLTCIFINCAFNPFRNQMNAHVTQLSYFINLLFPVLLQNGGPYLAIYLWGFMFALALLMMTIYPIMIAPLFNKFTPVSIFSCCTASVIFLIQYGFMWEWYVHPCCICIRIVTSW